MRDTASVVHVDLDAFFAAVEQRHKPSLRGKPVVVGGTGGRGVVATASYEARAFGVRSAMSIVEARALCPHAAFLSPRFAAYRSASQRVMEVLREVSGRVEQVSIDEAYLDLTVPPDAADPEGTPQSGRLPQQDSDGLPHEVGAWIREQIVARTRLTASVGVGTSKLIAKIASDLRKPDALTVVPAGTELDLLHPLPIRSLPGIGPATAARLGQLGIRTVGDLARSDETTLVSVLGQAAGRGLLALAHAQDDRPVVPEREAKSISTEQTFPVDVADPRELRDRLTVMAATVAWRLRAEKLTGRTVTVKVRSFDFTTLTRSTTLGHPTDDVRLIARCAVDLLSGVDTRDGVRLLGVGVHGLATYAQEDLLAQLEEDLAVPEPAEGAAADEAHPVEDTPPADGAVPRVWRPGADVHHAVLGPGWVWGSGLGRVTVRFEGPGTPPGPVRTFLADDPDLAPAPPPDDRPDDAGSAEPGREPSGPSSRPSGHWADA